MGAHHCTATLRHVRCRVDDRPAPASACHTSPAADTATGIRSWAMSRLPWLLRPLVVLPPLLIAACSSSTSQASGGVEVTFTNSNAAAVILYGCPPSICEGAAKLPGSHNPPCPAEDSDPPCGGFFGFAETRTLPRTYRLTLHGVDIHCPPATAPPQNRSSSDTYAVNYEITVSGRCQIFSHSPHR
jgi:hypothetical protein